MKINKFQNLYSDQIIVVSGLPRSGTSMMMNLLNSGGIPVLVDGIRKADSNNPNGYWEFERVKNLQEGDFKWLTSAKGKGVKVISYLLNYLPETFSYKIVFLERNIKEILASQSAMISNFQSGNQFQDDEKMKVIFNKHLEDIKLHLSNNKCFDTLYLNYNNILATPSRELRKLNNFFNNSLDSKEMLNVVDKSLYRQRNKR